MNHKEYISANYEYYTTDEQTIIDYLENETLFTIITGIFNKFKEYNCSSNIPFLIMDENILHGYILLDSHITLGRLFNLNDLKNLSNEQFNVNTEVVSTNTKKCMICITVTDNNEKDKTIFKLFAVDKRLQLYELI